MYSSGFLALTCLFQLLPIGGNESSVPYTGKQCLMADISSHTNVKGILLALCLKGRFVLWLELETMDCFLLL